MSTLFDKSDPRYWAIWSLSQINGLIHEAETSGETRYLAAMKEARRERIAEEEAAYDAGSDQDLFPAGANLPLCPLSIGSEGMAGALAREERPMSDRIISKHLSRREAEQFIFDHADPPLFTGGRSKWVVSFDGETFVVSVPERAKPRPSCCEVCDRNPTCGVDCGSCTE